ncbi:hypothetical protein ACTA71_009321 [Dictyostelium dimigraforme]
MVSFNSIGCFSENPSIKTKKTFKEFKNEFPNDQKMKTKVNELIREKDFSKLMEMMKNGEKFLLSKDNIHKLLLNCHDKQFYEILYEKGLLYNFNFIEESIKLDCVEALELMVQFLAGGWDNEKENGEDFYIILQRYAVMNCGLTNFNVPNYLTYKIKKVDQLFLIAFIIHQSFDIDNFKEFANKSELKEYKNNEHYGGYKKLKNKIKNQINVYDSIIRKYAISMGKLISKKKIPTSIDEIEEILKKLKKIGGNTMVINNLKLDLESTMKLEKGKWITISIFDTSDYLNTFISALFNISLGDAIKEICKLKSEIFEVFHPKFTDLTKLSMKDRVIFQESGYFSFYAIHELIMKSSASEEEEKESYHPPLKHFFYNSRLSLSNFDTIDKSKKSTDLLYLPPLQDIINSFGDVIDNVQYKDGSKTSLVDNNVLHFTKQQFIEKYIEFRYSANKISKSQQIQKEILSDSIFIMILSDVFPSKPRLNLYDIGNSSFSQSIKTQSKKEIKMQTKQKELYKSDVEKKLKEEKGQTKQSIENKTKREKKKLENQIISENKKNREIQINEEFEKIKLEFEKSKCNNKNKQKTKNKKKNKPLMFEVVEKSNADNLKNLIIDENQNNNYQEIGNNLNNYEINNKNQDIGNNLNNNYIQQQFFEKGSVFEEKEDYCLDPNIQNEIDEKVSSLVYDNGDEEEDNFITNVPLLVSNQFNLIF